jgi:ABC-2 type transport system permease protein
MRSLWLVAERELRVRLRSKAYLAATLVAPLTLALLVYAPRALVSLGREGPEQLALLDETGKVGKRLAPALEATGRFEVRLAPPGVTERALRAELARGELDGYLVIPARVWSGEETVYRRRGVGEAGTSQLVETLVNGEILRRRMAVAGLDSAEVAAIERPVSLRTERIRAGGEESVSSWSDRSAAAQGFVILLYVMILTYGISLKTAVTEEKANRNAELLFSSVSPFQLLGGKLLGVGAGALLQYLVWVASVLLVLKLARDPLATAALPSIPASLWIWFLFFFCTGFLLYGSFYLALGTLASTHEEAQHLQLPATVFVILAFFFSFYVMGRPESPVAAGLSLFPLFSPILLFARVAGSSVPLWQLALGISLLLGSIALMVLGAAKIYRTAMLLQGRRPGVREVLAWFRRA